MLKIELLYKSSVPNNLYPYVWEIVALTVDYTKAFDNINIAAIGIAVSP
jgi:preprotein translocase subunit SecB